MLRESRAPFPLPLPTNTTSTAAYDDCTAQHSIEVLVEGSVAHTRGLPEPTSYDLNIRGMRGFPFCEQP